MSELRPAEGFASAECARCHEALEARWIDGAGIDEADLEFIDNHVAGCEECATFLGVVGAMEEIPELPDTLAEQIVSHHQERKRVARLKRVVGLPVAAALAAAAALLLVLNVPAGHSPGELGEVLSLEAVTGNPVAGGVARAEGSVIHEGQRVSTGESQALLKGGELLTVGLDRQSGVALGSLRRKRVEIGLERGRMAVELVPDSAIDLAVVTPDARVVVTGTVFAVDVGDEGALVRVVRGSVRVESRQLDGGSAVLEAGSSLVVTGGVRSDLSAESEHEILALLHKVGEGSEQASDRTSAETEETPAAEEAEAGPEEADTAHAGDASAGRRRESARRSARSPRPVEELAPAEATVTPNALIRAARRCRASRDWGCAIEMYEHVVNRYPNRVESATVLVPLAEIELEKVRRPGRALRHYKEYRRRMPGGPLAQEALLGSCKALAALGRTRDEARALEQFLSHYPRSAYAPNARKRLEELSRGEN